MLAEFFAQGDRERGAGLAVSPMCDRHTTSRPGSQVNFIEFVVAPLFTMVRCMRVAAGRGGGSVVCVWMGEGGVYLRCGVWQVVANLPD